MTPLKLSTATDIQEKRLFVFKANHGLLDIENGKVRFKA